MHSPISSEHPKAAARQSALLLPRALRALGLFLVTCLFPLPGAGSVGTALGAPVWAGLTPLSSPEVPQWHHGAVRGHLLSQLTTVMVTSLKRSLGCSSDPALPTCGDDMEKYQNPGSSVPPADPNPPFLKPVSQDSQAQFPCAPPQCRQPPNPVPGTDVVHGC